MSAVSRIPYLGNGRKLHFDSVKGLVGNTPRWLLLTMRSMDSRRDFYIVMRIGTDPPRQENTMSCKANCFVQVGMGLRFIRIEAGGCFSFICLWPPNASVAHRASESSKQSPWY